MTSRHYKASQYDYQDYDEDEYDGYEGDAYEGDYEEEETTPLPVKQSATTAAAPAKVIAKPLPTATATSVSVPAKVGSKKVVATSVTPPTKASFPPLAAAAAATPSPESDPSGDSANGETNVTNDNGDDDYDNEPIMSPTLGRSASDHVIEADVDSDVIHHSLPHQPTDDDDKQASGEDNVGSGLSLADFIVTKKRGKGSAAAAAPTALATPVEGSSSSIDDKGDSKREGGTEDEKEDESGEEVKPSEEGKQKVDVDSLSRFHEFASFSLTNNGLLRNNTESSSNSGSGFQTSATELKVADTTREVWLMILQYLDPESLARSTGTVICDLAFLNPI
jgi:hypothetical protein